jgi:hypothetical protein
MLFAHPLDQTGGLPYSPFFLGCLGVVLLWLIITWKGGGPEGRAGSGEDTSASWEGDLTRSQWTTRILSIALLLLCMVAARIGSENELDNVAPALAIGVALPFVLVLTLLTGAAWKWLDPWDGLARLVTEDAETDRPGTSIVRASLPAFALVWYFYAYDRTLTPRSLGIALAVYTLTVLAGCLAFGRRVWMAEGEPIGIFLAWLARLRHGAFAGWTPPHGAELLLGCLLGGPLFYAVRLSSLNASSVEDTPLVGGMLQAGLDRINDPSGGNLYRAIGLAAFVLLAAGLVRLALRWSARHEGRAATLGAVVPAAAFLILAVSLARSRLFTSIQLLPSLMGDPFGRGWDLLGTWGTPVDPNPLGTTGRIAVEAGLVFIGHAIGAFVLRATAPPAGRIAGGVFLSLSLLAGVVAVSGA